jgi:hypothetical protein
MAEVVRLSQRKGFGAVVPVDVVTQHCDALAAAAHRAGTDLVVFRGDVRLPYACEALHYGELHTLFPRSERRTWRLHEEDRRRRARVLVSDTDQSWCDQIHETIPGCAPVPGVPGAVTIDFPAQPVVELWRHLGEPLRKFDRP